MADPSYFSANLLMQWIRLSMFSCCSRYTSCWASPQKWKSNGFKSEECAGQVILSCWRKLHGPPSDPRLPEEGTGGCGMGWSSTLHNFGKRVPHRKVPRESYQSGITDHLVSAFPGFESIRFTFLGGSPARYVPWRAGEHWEPCSMRQCTYLAGLPPRNVNLMNSNPGNALTRWSVIPDW